MKIIILIFIILSFSVLAQNEKRIVIIDENNQGGFNIYSNSGELLYEFTKQNTDSSTLKTLDDISLEADSLSDKVTKVEIINPPEKSFLDRYAILINALSVLFGVFVGWLFSYFSQKKLIGEQFKLQQEKDWLSEFINLASEYLTFLYMYTTKTIDKYGDKRWIFEKKDSDVELHEIGNKLFMKQNNIHILLDKTIKDELELHELMLAYANNLRKIQIEHQNYNKLKTTIEETVNNITNKVYFIVDKKRELLRKL